MAFKIHKNPFSAGALAAPEPRWGAHDAPHIYSLEILQFWAMLKRDFLDERII